MNVTCVHLHPAYIYNLVFCKTKIKCFALFTTVTSMDSLPNAQGDSSSPYVNAVQR